MGREDLKDMSDKEISERVDEMLWQVRTFSDGVWRNAGFIIQEKRSSTPFSWEDRLVHVEDLRDRVRQLMDFVGEVEQLSYIMTWRNEQSGEF